MDGPVGESCVKLPTHTVHRPHHPQSRVHNGRFTFSLPHRCFSWGGLFVGWGGPFELCLTWRRKVDEDFHCKKRESSQMMLRRSRRCDVRGSTVQNRKSLWLLHPTLRIKRSTVSCCLPWRHTVDAREGGDAGRVLNEWLSLSDQPCSRGVFGLFSWGRSGWFGLIRVRCPCRIMGGATAVTQSEGLRHGCGVSAVQLQSSAR